MLWVGNWRDAFHSRGPGMPSCSTFFRVLWVAWISRDNSDVCARPVFPRVTHQGRHPHNSVHQDSVSLVGASRGAPPFSFKAQQSAELESSQALRKRGVGIPSLLKADLKHFLVWVSAVSWCVWACSQTTPCGRKGTQLQRKGETMAISGCHIPGEGHLTWKKKV